MLVDIFMTTKGRPDLLNNTLRSLHENTDRSLYRFTLIDDTGVMSIESGAGHPYDRIVIDRYVSNTWNRGLGPAINDALALIDSENRWNSHLTHGDKDKVSQFVCYCQDDLIFSKGWLEKLIKFFTLYENQYKLGFASGVECIEHKKRQDLPGGMMLKDWIRAAQMFGRREYWMSMWPIPPLDPETGRLRAKPDNGMGSGVDWHFVRNHENSVCRTGRTCLVIPGLVKHAGYARSTWLNRELPESESDKLALKEMESGS